MRGPGVAPDNDKLKPVLFSYPVTNDLVYEISNNFAEYLEYAEYNENPRAVTTKLIRHMTGGGVSGPAPCKKLTPKPDFLSVKSSFLLRFHQSERCLLCYDDW